MRLALKLGMSLSEYYESTDRDLHNFIQAGLERQNEEYELAWNVARHEMWASIAPHTKETITPARLVPMKGDVVAKEMTPFEKQWLAEWEAEQDKEMNINGR